MALKEHRGLVEAAKERRAPPGLTASELCALQTLLLTAFHGTTTFGDPSLGPRDFFEAFC